MHLGLNIGGAAPDLQALLKADAVAFDAETIGLQPNTCTLLGFSCASKDNGAFYFPWGGNEEGALVLGMLGDNRILKLAHNASFDRSVLKVKSGVCMDNVIDTMIAAHMANEPVLALKPLVAHWVEGHPRITQFSELRKPIGSMTFTELCAYSGPHSFYLFPLWAELKQKLINLGSYKAFMDLEMPFLPVLSDMELNGACIDTSILTDLGKKFNDKLDYLQEALDHYSGIPNINYNSPQQVAELLYGKLKLPVWKLSKVTGAMSTDADSLERLKGKHPVVNLVLLYRQYGKLKGTYVDGIIKRMIGNRIYTTFNQTGTRTGRLSSTDPNLQNIPMRRPEGRQIRRAFVAPLGHKLVKVDFDQMELRMMAHRSRDPILLDAFCKGRDIHIETAIRMFGDPGRRFDGKTMNFTIIFGGGDYEVARQTGLPLSEAKKRKKQWLDVYKGVKAFMDLAAKDYPEVGYAQTLFGRVRVIPELFSDNPSVRMHGVREALSTVIQGSCAEIMKLGMIEARKALKRIGTRMILQVHDELVLEVPTDCLHDTVTVLRKTMPYLDLSVPLTVTTSIGDNWLDMQEVKPA